MGPKCVNDRYTVQRSIVNILGCFLLDPVDPEDCFPVGETCQTTKDNVHDIFYFAVGDNFSCQQKCEDIGACNYWSQFTIETYDTATNKCFLFRDCENTEPCIDCITGGTTAK